MPVLLALPASQQAGNQVPAIPVADAYFLSCVAFGLASGVRRSDRGESIPWASEGGTKVQFFSCFTLLDLILYILVRFLCMQENVRPLCTSLK